MVVPMGCPPSRNGDWLSLEAQHDWGHARRGRAASAKLCSHTVDGGLELCTTSVHTVPAANAASAGSPSPVDQRQEHLALRERLYHDQRPWCRLPTEQQSENANDCLAECS